MQQSPRVLLAGLILVTGCSATSTLPEAVARLRGVRISHALTVADSTRLATHGQVVAFVRLDSVVLLLTREPPTDLLAVPGVSAVGPALGTSSEAIIEIGLGVSPAPIETASAILKSLGEEVGRFGSLEVLDGLIPARRLAELNAHPEITFLRVFIDPLRTQD